MKRLKILLQEPFVPQEVTYGKFSKGAGTNTFSYGMASLASYIKARGYSVMFLDPNLEGMSGEEYLRFLGAHQFDVIGMGSTTLQIDYAFECFSVIKRHFPTVKTVLGGVHPTLMPEETLATSGNIDYVVMGEGEKPFFNLLECLEKDESRHVREISGICCRIDGELVLNIPREADFLPAAEIPMPCFDIFPMRKYVAQITFAKDFPSYTVIASRGCPFRCAFCNASATVGKKVRLRPVDSLLEEIRTLKEAYGARGIMFLDSTLTLNKAWLMEFCAAYIRSGLRLPWAANSRTDTVDQELLTQMKKAGCWSVTFGIESANQRSLDLIQKGTTVEQNTRAVAQALKTGLNVLTSYIICLPGETEADARHTIDYARKLGNHMAMFYLPIPFPGTQLSRMCRDMGGLRENVAWSDYNAWDYTHPVYVNPLIGKEKMQELYNSSYISFYSNPMVWYRNIKDMFVLRQDPYRYWMAARSFWSLVCAPKRK